MKLEERKEFEKTLSNITKDIKRELFDKCVIIWMQISDIDCLILDVDYSIGGDKTYVEYFDQSIGNKGLCVIFDDLVDDKIISAMNPNYDEIKYISYKNDINDVFWDLVYHFESYDVPPIIQQIMKRGLEDLEYYLNQNYGYWMEEE